MTASNVQIPVRPPIPSSTPPASPVNVPAGGATPRFSETDSGRELLASLQQQGERGGQSPPSTRLHTPTTGVYLTQSNS
jgi:hypothetical protein